MENARKKLERCDQLFGDAFYSLNLPDDGQKLLLKLKQHRQVVGKRELQEKTGGKLTFQGEGTGFFAPLQPQKQQGNLFAKRIPNQTSNTIDRGRSPMVEEPSPSVDNKSGGTTIMDSQWKGVITDNLFLSGSVYQMWNIEPTTNSKRPSGGAGNGLNLILRSRTSMPTKLVEVENFKNLKKLNDSDFENDHFIEIQDWERVFYRSFTSPNALKELKFGFVLHLAEAAGHSRNIFQICKVDNQNKRQVKLESYRDNAGMSKYLEAKTVGGNSTVFGQVSDYLDSLIKSDKTEYDTYTKLVAKDLLSELRSVGGLTSKQYKT